jgi:disulfide oxidoreductase YuzD
LFYKLRTGRYLDSIKSALEKKFQKNGFETQIVEISDSVIDEGQLNAAIKRLKPTHIFRMKTISAMTVNGDTQNITWQIEVHQRGAKPNTNTFEAAVLKSQIFDSYQSIYKFNIQSEICTGLRALRASTCADEFASTIEAALIKNSIK